MLQPVLVIYAGGTIGMVPKYPEDPRSPLVPGSWADLVQWAPQLDRLGFPVRAISIGTPRDSSDVSSREWIEIAHLIRDHYNHARGFVVLHGTDTMAYTATALGFMLRNLAKPVVVTGSLLPITAPRTDALQNFVSALTIAAGSAAGLPCVPEVCLFLRTHLFRGCRTTKINARSYDAFVSPNYPPLGEAGDRIDIFTKRIRRPSGSFRVRDALEHGVITIRITPDLDPAVLHAVLRQPQVKGVILETYGLGNAPSNPDLLAVLGDAIAAGKPIVAATQCLSGSVELGRYQAGAGLLDQGVISGLDMTTEAALIKLQILLGEHGDDVEAVSHLMQIDMAGEQSLSICNASFAGGRVTTQHGSPSQGLTADIANEPQRVTSESNSDPQRVTSERASEPQRFTAHYRSEPKRVTGTFDKENLRNAQLRLFGAGYHGRPADGVLLRAYFNLPATATDPGENAPEYAGAIRRSANGTESRETLCIDVTQAVESGLITPAEPVRFSLFSPTAVSLEWNRATLAIVTTT